MSRGAPLADGRGWSLLTIDVPPSRIDLALQNPDALRVAYEVGVLELLSIALAILGVALIVVGFGAYFSIQRAAKAAAGEVAKSHVPTAVEEFIRRDGFAVVRAVLSNPEALAKLQAEMDRLGLTDAQDAENVEG